LLIRFVHHAADLSDALAPPVTEFGDKSVDANGGSLSDHDRFANLVQVFNRDAPRAM
jgi:hypothetical protein